VVQFKCGGGLGEKMRVQFSAQVSSVIANTTQISKNSILQDFRQRNLEIQVILSEDQLIWFIKLFFSNHELKFLR
jgi:hypothetical protein